MLSGVVRLMVREEPVPSFMLMDLQGMSLVLYIYTLENGQIKVEKVSPFMLRWVIVVVISKRRIIIAEVMISPA
jgi:hypothetical protein